MIIIGKTVVFLDDDDQTDDLLIANEVLIKAGINRDAVLHPLPDTDILQPAVVVMSSGTTSVSKGVMLTQRNLIVELQALIQYKPFRENGIYFHMLPYSHLFGLLGEFLIPYYTGGTVCFSEHKLDLFRDLSRFKPTYLLVPPAIVDSIAKLLDTVPDPSAVTGGQLSTVITGGAFLNEQSRIALKKHGINVYIAYGLTECSPVISIERDGMERAGSVGQILPICNVKIENGEILVSGETVMKGYFNDTQATNSVIYDGYLHTGDLGYIADGYLYLTGRISNLIVFDSGEKLVPEQVEEDLSRIPWISESLVVRSTVASEIRIRVYCVLSEGTTAEESTTAIKQVVTKHVLPCYIDRIVFCHTPLKRNAIGKTDRKAYEI